MSELEELKQQRVLLLMGEKMVTAMEQKRQDPSSFVISWLKNRDRMQILLKSKVNELEIKKYSNCLDSDLTLYEKKGLIKKIEKNEYVLTIKGMLNSINIINSASIDECTLLSSFAERFFEDQIKIVLREEKSLDPTEKIWLLSMIVLNCFDGNSSIDVLTNDRNRKNYIAMYNKMGEFLLNEGYIKGFTQIGGNEFLRRELEHINKKIFDIGFNKERKSFHINIKAQPNKQEILSKLLQKIFEREHVMSKEQLDRIRSLIISSQSYFYKIERNGKGSVEWDSDIDVILSTLF